jgi:hypothetical protein
MDFFIAQVRLKGNYAGAMNLLYELSDNKILERLNNMKNFSLYTSYHDNEFKAPAEIITLPDVAVIKAKALDRFSATSAQLPFIIEYLPELWKYQDSPAFKEPDFEQAAKEWWDKIMETKE